MTEPLTEMNPRELVSLLGNPVVYILDIRPVDALMGGNQPRKFLGAYPESSQRNKTDSSPEILLVSKPTSELYILGEIIAFRVSFPIHFLFVPQKRLWWSFTVPVRVRLHKKN